MQNNFVPLNQRKEENSHRHLKITATMFYLYLMLPKQLKHNRKTKLQLAILEVFVHTSHEPQYLSHYRNFQQQLKSWDILFSRG